MKSIHLQKGLTLVELMVAMTIGLVLMLGATGVLITNQRAFATTESISLIQDNSRIAIDMIARDIRQAGGHPCLAMAINDHTAGNAAAQQMAGLLRDTNGIAANPEGINLADRNANQGALQIVTSANALTVLAHTAGQNTFTVDNDLEAGNIIIACTTKTAHLMLVNAATPTTVTVAAAPNFDLTGASIATGLSMRTWYINNGNFLSLSENGADGVPMVDNVFGMTTQEMGNGAFEVRFVLCSRNREQPEMLPPDDFEDPNNPEIAVARNTCTGDGRISRQVTAVVQRRNA
jgi:type IV pilus assembly protein PilW